MSAVKTARKHLKKFAKTGIKVTGFNVMVRFQGDKEVHEFPAVVVDFVPDRPFAKCASELWEGERQFYVDTLRLV